MRQVSQSDGLFSRRPPVDLDDPQWQVVRVPPTGRLRTMVISADLIGCYVHFWRGRSLPCINPQTCEACNTGQIPRWSSFLAVWNPTSQRKAILQLPLNPIGTIDTWHKANGSLRGVDLEAWRSSGKANGKVFVSLKKRDLSGMALPKVPSLEKMLRRMWEIADVVKIGDGLQVSDPLGIEEREAMR